MKELVKISQTWVPVKLLLLEAEAIRTIDPVFQADPAEATSIPVLEVVKAARGQEVIQTSKGRPFARLLPDQTGPAVRQ